MLREAAPWSAVLQDTSLMLLLREEPPKLTCVKCPHEFSALLVEQKAFCLERALSAASWFHHAFSPTMDDHLRRQHWLQQRLPLLQPRRQNHLDSQRNSKTLKPRAAGVSQNVMFRVVDSLQ